MIRIRGSEKAAGSSGSAWTVTDPDLRSLQKKAGTPIEQATRSRDRGSDSSPLVHRQPGIYREIPETGAGSALCGTG